jgi:hypothetical protein
VVAGAGPGDRPKIRVASGGVCLVERLAGDFSQQACPAQIIA